MGRENQTQIAIWVDAELYRRYKEVLKARVPRSNTTRDLVEHIAETVKQAEQEAKNND